MTRWIVREDERPRRFDPWIVAAIVPLSLLVFLVARNGLDLPLIDQWSFVPLIERFHTGTLTLADLWTQHGEHRLIFPRIIMLGLGGLTGWNIRYELGVSVLLAIGIFFVLVRIIGRDRPPGVKPLPGWWWALLSLAVFSLSQWENWLWGWQMQVFLNVLCVAGTIAVLTRRPLGWKTVAAAGLVGVAATYSFGNGLLVWPVGLALVGLAPEVLGRRSALLAFWAVLSGVVIWSYLADFQRNPSTPPLETVFVQPLTYLRYVATYLGSPLASFSGSAWPPRDTGVGAVVGAAGVVVLLLTTRRTLRRPRTEWPLGSLALAAYAIGSGLVVSLARFSFGTPNAFASRYTTVSTLFWIGTLGVVWAVARGEAPNRRRLWLGAIAAAATLIAVSSVYSIPIFSARRAFLLPARAEMTRGEDVELLKRLHPEVQQVTFGLVVLRRFRLSVFRDARTVQELVESRPKKLARFGQILRPIFRVESVRPKQELTIPVRITNPTTELWSASGDGTGTYAVHLSYHWIDFAGRAVVYDGYRTALPHDLRTGESVSVEARVAAPPIPGRYVLRLSMVQEGVSWFDSAAGGASDLPVEVVP